MFPKVLTRCYVLRCLTWTSPHLPLTRLRKLFLTDWKSFLYESIDFSFWKYFYRYGDCHPISVPGRLLAICSILTGIIINALFISAMTSSLTVFVTDETANPERGSKVSSLISDCPTHPNTTTNSAIARFLLGRLGSWWVLVKGAFRAGLWSGTTKSLL